MIEYPSSKNFLRNFTFCSSIADMHYHLQNLLVQILFDPKNALFLQGFRKIRKLFNYLALSLIHFLKCLYQRVALILLFPTSGHSAISGGVSWDFCPI